MTLATLDATIRAYVFGEDNSQDLSDSLVQDIEHVIYSLGDNPDKGILDITIDNISTDVIVVGGGAAGVAAAHTVSKQNLKVILKSMIFIIYIKSF